ncbi:MAG: hypothetical protein PF436_06300 [Prolixibacteraceae bacterium]|jgi:hypothetical protein|nr:hypothetical protein [Prolixibacteraceae bacterium]
MARNIQLLFISTILILAGISCKQKGDTPLKGTFNTTISYDEFVSPSVEYRSFPFYSLNDKLEPAEIKRQVKSFSDAGMGGFYLHSRDGLLTEYLGDEWWDAMDAAVDEANKLGLHACFYDEDKWPSGYAGGKIPRMGKEFRAKSLARLKKSTPLPEGAEIIRSDENYNYIVHTAAMGNPKFNGTCWVDLMNPMVVDSFINSTHKLYLTRFKGLSKRYTPAIFSDEPHIHARYFDRSTPNEGIYTYSPTLVKKFEKLWGYSFLDKIDLLFEKKDNWREVRLHYYRTVALQFEESFTRQIANYCEANGFKFTGHFLGEDRLSKVRDRIGNSMLHYRNMQQPGIDHLGLQISGRLITARRLTSVANQFDTPRRMSELFGITGHNMNFEDRKWIAGWHAIMGINHFAPHLTAYSLKGLRKRDYPPTFSYHQPYWKFNKEIEDYMARLAYATTIGKIQPQLLVVSPLESEYAKSNDESEFTYPMLQVLRKLQAAHYDYDIGDEQIMADTAYVDNGQIVIGAMQYPNVVLPDMITIRQSTYKMLQKVADAGGKIIYTHRFPEFIDGLPAPVKLNSLKQKVIKIEVDNLDKQLPDFIDTPISLSGNNNELVWTQIRHTNNDKLVQFYNSSHTDAIVFNVNAQDIQNNPVLWDPSSGMCFKLSESKPGMYTIKLPASSSVWVTTGELSNKAKTTGDYQIINETQTVVKLNNNWTGKRLNPNALNIDFAKYQKPGEKWSNPEPVIAIMKELTEQNYNGELKLRYTFNIDHKPENINLSVEQPRMFRSIVLNNKPVSFTHDDFFLDHSFPVASIADKVKTGINTVEMELDFSAPSDTSRIQAVRYGNELESIYVFGDFAVKGYNHTVLNNTHRNATGLFIKRPAHGFTGFSITKEQTTFTGDVVPHGYPFYAGGFEMSQAFELSETEVGKNLALDFPNTEAIVMVVELNGEVLDTLTSSPFSVNISNAAKAGTNTLNVTLYNSLRNLLGPHHQKRGEITRVGPSSFTGRGGFPDPRGDSNWYELRKTGAETKIWTDTYYSIPLGFLAPPEISEIERL